jgi:tetratricopeptide (TPR) repeat protein
MSRSMPYRILISIFLVALGLTGAAVAADDAALYKQGMAAVAASDFALAFDKLEAAITADPNNLRYGTDYRQAVIAAGSAKDKASYERCIAFFEKIVTDHPAASNAWLNFGFAHVDKIPVEGSITQVILANTSLGHFGTALELDESWLGLYSRGHALLFWPPIFGRAGDGVADLERAVKISQAASDNKLHYARAWTALGDGHWRLTDLAKARKIWRQGQDLYPDDPDLKTRLELQDDAKLVLYLDAHYDTSLRVGTHLREIFASEDNQDDEDDQA